jgi:uncharacterized protein (TIGR02246 family)
MTWSFSKTTRRAGLLAIAACVAVSAAAILAEAKAKLPQDNSDEAQIRAAIDSYVAAYNRGDAKAVAALWSETGEWVSPDGERFKGRQAIEREMEEIFADSKGVKIEVIDPIVRLLSPDAAVEEGTVRVTRPGEPPSDSTYMAVHAKKNGEWKLEGVRETSLPETHPHEQLKQLEWLVGEWEDESPDVVVQQRYRWSEDGHYLLGNFVVQWKGRPSMKGDVRIGWDPLTKQIKSWIFDTEGGYGEGLWTKVGDRWVVKMTGVLPDGGTASSTNTFEPLRRDEFQYSSTDRIIGGDAQPDQSVRVVRKPPQPKKH